MIGKQMRDERKLCDLMEHRRSFGREVHRSLSHIREIKACMQRGAGDGTYVEGH